MADFVPLLSPSADWLDVTYHPADVPLEALSEFLLAYDFVPQTVSGENLKQYRHVDQQTLEACRGVLQVSLKQKTYRISASGDVLATLRRLGAFGQYLTILASSPHRVTRLDAALDVPQHAPSVIAALDLKYPQSVSLARQRPLKTSTLLSCRPDGARSGTWYAGRLTQARVTARVYDKSYELLMKKQIFIPDEYVRYEFTFRKGMATLNDVYNPDAIFYAHCSAVVTPPTDARPWVPSDYPTWQSDPVNVLPHEAMLRRVSSSADIQAICAMSELIGAEGVNAVMHALAKAVGANVKGIRFEPLVRTAGGAP